MNNLVAYGDESDDDSPRRRSTEASQSSKKRSTSPRQRRNSEVFCDTNVDSESGDSKSPTPRSDRSTSFAEPPPPKRRANDSRSPSPSARTPVTSVSSLVSYTGGDQDEEESFDKAEMNISIHQQSPSAEPAPPPRVSQDEGSDDENERIIDDILQESSAALKEMTNDESSTGSATPALNESPRTPVVNETIEELEDIKEVAIPPSPPGECDPEMQRKLDSFFRKKAEGYNFNTLLQSRRDFLNPSCYESFIERFQLLEKGSNFKPDIFNPFGFPENCYYDSIAEEQRKIMEKSASDAKSKKTTSTNR